MCTVPNLLFGLQLIGGRGVVLPFQLENKLGWIGLMRAAQKPSDELKGGGGVDERGCRDGNRKE